MLRVCEVCDGVCVCCVCVCVCVSISLFLLPRLPSRGRASGVVRVSVEEEQGCCYFLPAVVGARAMMVRFLPLPGTDTVRVPGSATGINTVINTVALQYVALACTVL